HMYMYHTKLVTPAATHDHQRVPAPPRPQRLSVSPSPAARPRSGTSGTSGLSAATCRCTPRERHYYKTGLCSWPFVPAAFGPGTIGGFCPGSNGYAGLLSRLDPPTGTKCPHFVPVGVSNRDKRPWPLYPLSSPPARAIQLTCFLLFSARERGVLAHFFTTFVKIFDSPSIHRR